MIPQVVNPTCGGMRMNATALWNAFLQTGAPELYLMYKQAVKMENGNVLDDTRPGDTGHTL